MSHIYKAQIELKEIVPSVMREAVFLVARALNAKVSSSNVIYDYYGNPHYLDSDWVVIEYKLHGNAKNIAVNIRTGEINADFYQRYDLETKLPKMLKDTYIGILAMKQIQSQLYTYSSNVRVNDKQVEIVLEVEV